MSYITVSSEKVRIAAQATIDMIMARRKEKDEQKIAIQMTKFFFSFKYPFVHYYNREQAITELKYNEWLNFPSLYAYGDLDKAENLLIMAENGDPVNIDNDDARILWG